LSSRQQEHFDHPEALVDPSDQLLSSSSECLISLKDAGNERPQDGQVTQHATELQQETGDLVLVDSDLALQGRQAGDDGRQARCHAVVEAIRREEFGLGDETALGEAGRKVCTNENTAFLVIPCSLFNT
jgi:hypothetical protein